MIIKTLAKSYLSKLKFILSLNPKVDTYKSSEKIEYIPEGYKAVVLISADFEMAWASRYSMNYLKPLEQTLESGRLSRKNIPLILDLCDKYSIPVTWATVGHLFLKECKPEKGIRHPELKRLPHFQNTYWKFDSGDWFDYDPGTDFQTNPEWYAPDLIESILKSKTKHEIGCHTFSHIDCSDQNCPDEVFASEVIACQKAAAEFGVKLSSFVHPGHTVGHIKDLADFGFNCYRSDAENVIGYPIRHIEGIWELRNTAQIETRIGWSDQYQVWRLKEIVKMAMQHKSVCNIWFHPQIKDSKFVQSVFGGLFEFLDANRKYIWITTFNEYISFLDSQLR